MAWSGVLCGVALLALAACSREQRDLHPGPETGPQDVALSGLWYGPYAALGLAAFGLTPAQDQQLAGALMWAPGGMFHALVAIAILAPALRAQASKA